MGLGVNVWIHSNRDRRGFAHGTGHLGQNLKFRFGFDIKTVNADLECPAHFARLFAHAAKHDLGWITTGQDNALQLTLADDIEARAGLC